MVGLLCYFVCIFCLFVLWSICSLFLFLYICVCFGVEFFGFCFL